MTSLALETTTQPLRIDYIRDAEGLAGLRDAWDALWLTCDALIFQSHGWIEAWWTHIPDRDTRQLLIACAWQGSMLVGIMPLATHRHRGLRILEWAARDHADYCDMLIHPQAPAGLARQIWQDVSRQGGYDLVLLNRLLPEARAHDLGLRGAGIVLSPNHRSEMSLRVVGPYANGEAWFSSQNKKTRQNYRRGMTYLNEGAETRFRLLPEDAELGPVLDRLSALKRAWLIRMGLEAPLFDDGAPLLCAFVEALRKTGQLRIFVLERADEIAAISINFVAHNRMMAFITTYDPAVEKGSPGMVLMVDYIRWAFDNGLDLVDFLCGAEDFKSRFASETVTLTSMSGAATLFGTAAITTDRVVERIRRYRAARAEARSDTDAA